MVDREQPSVQVLRELAEAGHPVVGEAQGGGKVRTPMKLSTSWLRR